MTALLESNNTSLLIDITDEYDNSKCTSQILAKEDKVDVVFRRHYALVARWIASVMKVSGFMNTDILIKARLQLYTKDFSLIQHVLLLRHWSIKLKFNFYICVAMFALVMYLCFLVH